MPGAFKLDHLQPIKPLLFPNFYNFFTFILGGQFLLPQRANNGKGMLSRWLLALACPSHAGWRPSTPRRSSSGRCRPRSRRATSAPGSAAASSACADRPTGSHPCNRMITQKNGGCVEQLDRDGESGIREAIPRIHRA